jgi:hypothetical protein
LRSGCLQFDFCVPEAQLTINPRGIAWIAAGGTMVLIGAMSRDFRDTCHLERSARTNSRFAQGSVKAETIQPPSLSIRIEEKISRYALITAQNAAAAATRGQRTGSG